MEMTAEKRVSWLDRPVLNRVVLNGEILLYVLLIILAVFTRFYDLESRVMSHDENTHVYYSWRFYQGQGLAHDPLMHGPFQFHLVALSYFMFGDNDFTARIPAVLFSIATVGFVWFYRRYLGKAGALAAGFLFLISPYMLFYGRYVRNETYVAFFGLVMLWGILRYLETGKAGYAVAVTAVTALHFATKETSFIYQAQALVFLAWLFLARVTRSPWKYKEQRNRFLIALMVALILLGGFGASFVIQGDSLVANPETTLAPATPGQENIQATQVLPSSLQLGLLVASLLVIAAAGYFLVKGYTWDAIRRDRSFGMLILLGTFVLPQLAAFPVNFVGWDVPTNASEVAAMTSLDIWHIAVFLVPLFLLSVAIGLLWNSRKWLVNAGVFYSLFIIFYTSLFTHGAGFLTGLVGSLGYWLEQQAVNRGSQPSYYYWLIQVPVYEYLPALGTILAILTAGFSQLFRQHKPAAYVGQHPADEVDQNTHDRMENDSGEQLPLPLKEPLPAAQQLALMEDGGSLEEEEDAEFESIDEYVHPFEQAGKLEHVPALGLFAFWSISSLMAYSVAGEKMPWLTVHITLPFILCAGWFLGKLIEQIDWSIFKNVRGWLAAGLLPVFVFSLSSTLSSMLGSQPPFQGQSLVQLQATSTFLTGLFGMVASGAGLIYLMKSWKPNQLVRLLSLSVFALLALLTARTAFQASYINYDNANELLVYAHSAGGVKTALTQIEEISIRTTDGLGMVVAYDNDTSYPYWWYLRNYPNARYYGAEPTRSLRDVPVILVGANNFGKIEPIVANLYDKFEYIRLWWPNQDYFGLTWDRVRQALSNPQMRAAVFQIWLNRDYTLYGQATGRDLSLPNWSPADRMRLYVRKDIVNQLWNYGAVATAEELIPDPFEGKARNLAAEKVIGGAGSEPGQFQRPRDLAVAGDGSLYVVDTDNNRIQHLSQDGSVLNMWGTFADASTGDAPGGTFYQPWGIGLGPDGSVYIADTWNHRVQKFTAEGEFQTMWGYFGQAEQGQAFWGPRDIVVSTDNRVFVSDTGNKRIVVFDADGNYLAQFGGAGMGPGQFDEPVGLAYWEGELPRIFVADTWNQRIQAFDVLSGDAFPAIGSWDLTAWYGQSLDNKPYMDVDDQGTLFIADPEGYRIVVLDANGQALYTWGDFGTGVDMFGMPASIALDGAGGAWVSDAGNSRLMYFRLPVE